MARTKMEVEAITSKIKSAINAAQEKAAAQYKTKAKAVFKKELLPLYKAHEKSAEKLKNYHIKHLGTGFNNTVSDDHAIDMIARKLAGVKKSSLEEIEREVILAGDAGVDVLVKKITQMFV